MNPGVQASDFRHMYDFVDLRKKKQICTINYREEGHFVNIHFVDINFVNVIFIPNAFLSILIFYVDKNNIDEIPSSTK